MFDEKRDIFSEAGRKEYRLNVETVGKGGSRTEGCPLILCIENIKVPSLEGEGRVRIDPGGERVAGKVTGIL